RTLWEQAVGIWLSGGWAMVALAINALVLFALGMHVLVKLAAKGHRSVPEKTWRHWIDHRDQRRGPIGRLLDFVGGARSIEQTGVFFEELRGTEIVPFERDLQVMKVCVSAAPLLGLLGTVTGMLATFGALATGSGGEKTMGLVAEGISEALVTTETGLIIALPGLFFQYHLSRQLERYKAFLAHLEAVCTQKQHKTLSRAGQEAVKPVPVVRPQRRVAMPQRSEKVFREPVRILQKHGKVA
ncbi:MotA/TolQ/ExbB proton channel family protein, partial [Anaerobaca lacustris]|nr:MotA/TolQ/ExbB proton channel family protein [Sedimentisphaerales bacterium M17dextr]